MSHQDAWHVHRGKQLQQRHGLAWKSILVCVCVCVCVCVWARGNSVYMGEDAFTQTVCVPGGRGACSVQRSEGQILWLAISASQRYCIHLKTKSSIDWQATSLQEDLHSSS
eukprot:1158848-Pelagomonas_calceolata.AAC.6